MQCHLTERSLTQEPGQVNRNDSSCHLRAPVLAPPGCLDETSGLVLYLVEPRVDDSGTALRAALLGRLDAAIGWPVSEATAEALADARRCPPTGSVNDVSTHCIALQ